MRSFLEHARYLGLVFPAVTILAAVAVACAPVGGSAISDDSPFTDSGDESGYGYGDGDGYGYGYGCGYGYGQDCD